ncbi:cytochrome c biogenesis protein ResB [Angustibacter speluncae]
MVQDLTTRRSEPSDGPERPDAPALGVVGTLRWAWRQLTSMRTALFLLMLLAVGAVPGSILPQRGVDATEVARYQAEHPDASPWLDRLGLFDVYSSVWFSAVYLLLFVSLVGCVVPRTRVHLAAMRARPPRAPSRLSRMPAHTTVDVDATGEVVLDAARDLLRRKRYRVDVRDGAVCAERGYLRETGNLLFHVALLGLLVAVALGSLYGYRGQFLLTTGTGFANTLSEYDDFDPGTWVDEGDLDPFQLTLDDLTVRFETEVAGNQFAAPRDFEAAVTLTDEPGAEPEPRTIRVNEPLPVGDSHVYLQGNGYAPVLTVRDGEGRVVKSGPVVFVPEGRFYQSPGAVKVLETQPQIGLQGVFLPTWEMDDELGPTSVFPDALDPRLFFTAYQGDLGLDDGSPQNVYELDTTDMTQLTVDDAPFAAGIGVGETVELPDGLGTVTLERIDRFAAFGVRHDPAKGWALGFSLAAIAGLVASLFVPRRRVWVRVAPAGGDGTQVTSGDGRIVVEVAALARSEDPRLAAEVEAVAGALRSRLTTGRDHQKPGGQD